VGPKGNFVVVTGQTSGASADFETVAYAASTGHQVWAQTFDGPDHSTDVALRVAVGSSGTFVTGQSFTGSASGSDYRTIGYNSSTGAVLWNRRYSGSGDNNDSPRGIAVSPDGKHVAVTGE